MDTPLLVILATFLLVWVPMIYYLVRGAAEEWTEGFEAFRTLVDEVTTESGERKVWFPRIEGRWRGRPVTLRVALGGGWIFEVDTKAKRFPATDDPAITGLAATRLGELSAIRAELAEWRNRGTLRIKGGRLQAWFPQEAQFSPARLERTAPLVARAAVLLEQISSLGEQGDRIRCPYCHDLLQSGAPGEPDSAPEAITSCEGCQTAHHESCYGEAGCTILGCANFGLVPDLPGRAGSQTA